MHPRALHSQECFLPLRGGFNLRCTRERYIPKNVFFLRKEVLIYDAPSLPRKDSRFDQELPSIRDHWGPESIPKGEIGGRRIYEKYTEIRWLSEVEFMRSSPPAKAG